MYTNPTRSELSVYGAGISGFLSLKVVLLQSLFTVPSLAHLLNGAYRGARTESAARESGESKEPPVGACSGPVALTHEAPLTGWAPAPVSSTPVSSRSALFSTRGSQLWL